jgi:BlaI family transcriptional regulator, penicillinase repressor
MKQDAARRGGSGPRHSILDLAPLELECMSALWPMGEGTVRDILGQLCVTRPRAYTTIMTIMDRLAHKGIVTRRKVGRAYRYQANLSAEEARFRAIEKIVAGFFGGSAEALAAHLASARETVRAHAPGTSLLNAPERAHRDPVDGADTRGAESVEGRQD